jgi:hypothetical protein
VTNSRVTQYPGIEKGEVIIPMKGINYFSGDSPNGDEYEHNNLELYCFS